MKQVWHLTLSYLKKWKIPFKDKVWVKVDQFVDLLTQKLRQLLELMPG
jgi:hypothetical protein